MNHLPPQQQKQQQQQHPLHYSFLPSPYRCFLIDVQLFLQGRQSPPGPTTTTLRILGIAVAVEYPKNSTSSSSSCGVGEDVNDNSKTHSNLKASEQDVDNNDDASMTTTKKTSFLDPPCPKATTATIWLDDGTALVPMQVPMFMMENMRTTARVPWQGATLECIVRLVAAAATAQPMITATPTAQTLPTEHTAYKFSIFTDQISIVQDVHVELLWWYELILRQNQPPSNTAAIKMSQEEEEDDNDDVSPAFDVSSPFSSPPSQSLWDHEYSFDMGYPTRSVTAEDLYDVIHCDYHNNHHHMHKNGGDGSKTPSPPMGVDQNDLALFFQLSPEMTESLLQELQLSGQIYRNPQGLYLPL